MIYKTIEGKKRGSYLGLYAASTSIANLVGSLLSGFASFHFVYAVTFLSASILIAIAAIALGLTPSKSLERYYG